MDVYYRKSVGLHTSQYTCNMISDQKSAFMPLLQMVAWNVPMS
jgi:hypothetical protein